MFRVEATSFCLGGQCICSRGALARRQLDATRFRVLVQGLGVFGLSFRVLGLGAKGLRFAQSRKQ